MAQANPFGEIQVILKARWIYKDITLHWFSGEIYLSNMGPGKRLLIVFWADPGH